MTPHSLLMHCAERNIFACCSDIWLQRKDEATCSVGGTAAHIDPILVLFQLRLFSSDHWSNIRGQLSGLELPKVYGNSKAESSRSDIKPCWFQAEKMKTSVAVVCKSFPGRCGEPLSAAEGRGDHGQVLVTTHCNVAAAKQQCGLHP